MLRAAGAGSVAGRWPPRRAEPPPKGPRSCARGRARQLVGLSTAFLTMVAGASEQLVPRLRGVSHAIAFVISIAAAIVVVALARTGGATISLGVYGAGLVALFGGSALYHRWPGPARFKPLLRRIDHSTIYVFIAASYTPIAVVVLHGTIAWMVLVIAWTGAAAGVAFRLGSIRVPRAVEAGSYLALGWIAVIAIPQLLGVLGLVPLALLGAVACCIRSAP